MRSRHFLAGAVTIALVAVRVTGLASSASADATVSDFTDLQAAFTSATSVNQTVDLSGSISATLSTLTLPADAAIILSLDGREVDVQNVVLGTGSTLTVTDTPFHQPGLLDASAKTTSGDVGIETTGATLNISGAAVVEATGGTDGAGVGGSGGSLTISDEATVIGDGAASGVGGGSVASGGSIDVGDDPTLEAGATDAESSAVGTGDAFANTFTLDESTFTGDGLVTLDTNSYNSSAIIGHGLIQGPGSIDNQNSIRGTIVVDTRVSGASYPVQFFWNLGGAGSSASADDSFASIRAYGPSLDSVGIVLPVPMRTGYLFGGWNQSRDGSGLPFKSDTGLINFHVAYAQWLATISKVTVSGSSFKKGADPKVKATVAKTSIGTYAVGEVDIYVNSVFTSSGTLTLADKGVISITLPAQTKKIKVQAVYVGNSTTETKSSSIVSIKVK